MSGVREKSYISSNDCVSSAAKLSSCCSAINSAHNTCENYHAPFRGGKSLKKSVLVNKPFLIALWIPGSEHNSWFALLTKSASLLPAKKARLHVREGWDHWYRNRVLVSAWEKANQSCTFYLLVMARVFTAAQIAAVDIPISLPALTAGSGVFPSWRFLRTTILQPVYNLFQCCSERLMFTRAFSARD